MLKNIVYIAVLIAAFALLWIVFSIKHNYDTSTIPSEIHANIVPITPKFDTTTLEQLKTRTQVRVDLSTPTSSSDNISSTSAASSTTKAPTQPVSPSPEITPVISGSTAIMP